MIDNEVEIEKDELKKFTFDSGDRSTHHENSVDTRERDRTVSDNDTKPFELNKPKMMIITQIGKRNRRKMYFVFGWFGLLHQTMTRQNVLHWLEVFRLLKTEPQNISIWLVKQTRWQEQSQMIETNELNKINASTIRWMEFSWR